MQSFTARLLHGFLNERLDATETQQLDLQAQLLQARAQNLRQLVVITLLEVIAREQVVALAFLHSEHNKRTSRKQVMAHALENSNGAVTCHQRCIVLLIDHSPAGSTAALASISFADPLGSHRRQILLSVVLLHFDLAAIDDVYDIINRNTET